LNAALAIFGVPREGADGTLIFMIQMMAIFAIFYFLLIRPQRKEQQRHQEMIRTVKKGDDVVTAGGIIGTVLHAQEDRLTLRTGENTRIVVERARVAKMAAAGHGRILATTESSMALRDIRLFGDPVLREPARDIAEFAPELARLVEDMFETMYHAQGIGLAGPQIGISSRVLVVDVRETDDEMGGRFGLINPVVAEWSRATERAPEGCLSIPGLEEVVERPTTVVVEAKDPSGAPVRIEAAGLLARALQHEIDHLDGVLFIDRVTPLKRKMLLKKWKKSQEEATDG